MKVLIPVLGAITRDIPFAVSTSGIIILCLVGFIALMQIIQVFLQIITFLGLGGGKELTASEKDAKRKGMI